MESCISRSFHIKSCITFRKESSQYSLNPHEVAVGRYLNGDQEVAHSTQNEGKLFTQTFLRRGNLGYREQDHEFVKSIGLLIVFPIITLLAKVLIPILLIKPLHLYASVFKDQKRIKKMENIIFKHFNPKSIRPLRALVAIVGHVAIGILALIPPFSNFFNKLNGDLERWVAGCTVEDIKQKSYRSRIKEDFYIAPCQQPLFFIDSKEKVINYTDLQHQDTNLNILKAVAREID
jgi:hypothetical protein